MSHKAAFNDDDERDDDFTVILTWSVLPGSYIASWYSNNVIFRLQYWLLLLLLSLRLRLPILDKFWGVVQIYICALRSV